jgi:citrate lyase subunit beta/citryl-CoA lyase
MTVEDTIRGSQVIDRLREQQRTLIQDSERLRAELPLRYLRQQAHLTAPASDARLAEKALAGAHAVAGRLLARYAISAPDVAARLDVATETVADLLEGGGAPVVLLDLEDGVAPGSEARARASAVSLLRDVDRGSSLCFLRPAGVEEPRCVDDLVEVLLGAGSGRGPDRFPLDGIVVPKVRHPEEVEWLDELLTAIERDLGLAPASIRVSLQIESAWGTLNLPELAVRARSRLAGLILGTVDLSADLMLPEVRYRHPSCEWARRVLVAVAGALGVPAIDGMTLDFPVPRAGASAEENREWILQRMRLNYEDCRYSIDAGMSGRWTGHPLQLVATELAFHAAFAKGAIEAKLSEVSTFAAATREDRGAVAGDRGELLDMATDRHVRLLLRRAAAWGYLAAERAAAAGVISAAEARALTP